jgi:cytidine deaminase
MHSTFEVLHVWSVPSLFRYCLTMIPSSPIPWNELREQARHAATTSFAPYSHVRVGACAITTDGRIAVGANVENASYGLSLCAECSLIGDLARIGGGRLRAASIVGGDGEPMSPCGRCRQLLFEHGGNELLIDAGDENDPTPLSRLLPDAFGLKDLGRSE